MGRATLLSVAQPWQCDQMGHMNVRHYAGLFDDASFQFLGHLAGPDPDEGLGWADVRIETDFCDETAAGTLLTVTTRVEKVGRSSVTYRHAMTDSQTGALKAEARVTTVRFDLAKRRSAPLEDGARARAEALIAA
ncbi:acyl-CoA thioesterase [Psychromarinibacter sp. C21-152]|uniref:Acyl-CoA thioesterase n=1 Tax=Psychromarinibacter sediminicola TaxID=3033385 RepID=A0AAE3T7D3_9RHOB|nr:acyl-CoA thioesterase [Psychromarinibacter sediminicola]MDF0600202.1 acyl-CoA thioesterase [Psychromarinibacter sediminicola]